MLGKHKRSDPGDPGHIVPNTKGTSNEISFSVLHQMRNAAAEEGASARPAWEFPHDEVRQRRRARRRGKRLMMAGIVVAVLAVVALGATAVVVNMQNQMDHVARMKGVLTQVADECNELKPYVDTVSAAVAQPLDTVDLASMKSAYEAATPMLSSTADDLRQLKGQLEEVQQHLQVPGDREAANQGIAAINAQLNLIDQGQAIMEWALPAQEAYAAAKEAMEQILRADTLADEATERIAQLNADNARASQEASQQAQEALTQARDDLETAQEIMQQLEARMDGSTFAGDTMDTYVEYAQRRLEAQAAAVRSMQAYLDRDKVTLQQANDQYNQLEQQAADMIGTLGATPADAFASVFTAARATEADQWTAETARLAQALSAVHVYLS